MRAAALLLSAQGRSAVQVGTALGVTPRAVHACRRRWREEGTEALPLRAGVRPAAGPSRRRADPHGRAHRGPPRGAPPRHPAHGQRAAGVWLASPPPTGER
ncbi:helix-turn-helix domain-containing protein [Corallococcus terminator]|uniref:Helix-turn-helix domain-containing protein n=1 Tax=Corallococcus terminator TaxID=2316733 RepID=A0A3A8IVT6_9BACT|nr:helix-turn-helix domain-containing protein [Corallococcus terminator]